MNALDRLAKRMRFYSICWAVLIGGLAAIIIIGASKNSDCASDETQQTVLNIIRQNPFMAMTKTDNPAIGNEVKTMELLNNLNGLVNPYDPQTKFRDKLLKTIVLKLKFIGITEVQGDGANSVCEASVEMGVPAFSDKDPAQSGTLSFRYMVQPNLADKSGKSIIRIYW